MLMSVLLFWEGLYPLLEFTETKQIHLFLIGFLLFMLIHTSSLSRWIKSVLFGIGIYLLLYWIFFSQMKFSKDIHFGWVLSELSIEWGQMEGVSSYHPSEYPVIGSLLLLVVLLCLAYVWKYLFLQKGWIYLPVIFVSLVLMVINSFWGVDVESAIIRIAIYFILTRSWLQWEKVKAHVKHLDQAPSRWKMGTFIILILIIVVSSLSATTFSCVGKPIWIEGADGSGEGISLSFFGSKRIGYSSDDRKLGGPLKMDETVLFKAISDHRTYWRGEPKNIYTGQGWISVENRELDHAVNGALNKENLTPNPDQGFYNLFYQLPTQENRVKMVWEEWKYSTLFVPGQLKSLTLPEYEEKHPFTLVFSREGSYVNQIRLQKGIKPLKVEMVTQLPEWNEKEFRKSRPKDSIDYSISIDETELPQSVPQRIQDLALQITADRENNYDRAKAIEIYLKSGTFQYETDHVPYVPKGRDFVDHFIFDSKKGYCDHFSTSMVVMLRSIGIPARWVKGFAPGEATFDSDTGKYVTTVKNKDAHSWVEVYLDGIGWIPFEPTPTFSNSMPQPRSEGTSVENSDPLSPVEDQTTSSVQKQERLEKELELDESTSSVQKIESESAWKWKEVLLGMGGLLLVIGVVWKFRMYIQWLLLFRFTEKGDQQTFFTAYGALLKWFEKLRGKRAEHQTLREYWDRQQENQPETIFLTKQYEKARYGIYDKKENAWRLAWKIWKNLIKQLRP